MDEIIVNQPFIVKITFPPEPTPYFDTLQLATIQKEIKDIGTLKLNFYRPGGDLYHIPLIPSGKAIKLCFVLSEDDEYPLKAVWWPATIFAELTFNNATLNAPETEQLLSLQVIINDKAYTSPADFVPVDKYFHFQNWKEIQTGKEGGIYLDPDSTVEHVLEFTLFFGKK